MALTQLDDRTRTRIRRRLVHPAWKIGGSVVVVAMLVFGAVQVVVALAHEERTIETEFPAEGVAAIEVDNGAGGPVEIIGTSSESDSITVRAHVSDGMRKTGHRERVVGDRLVLESSCPDLFSDFCRVSYTVRVPEDLDVLVSVDSGHVTVTDIAGDVSVSSEESGIDLARIGGTVRARSHAGGIEATELTAPQLEAASDAGRVSAEFTEAPQSVAVDSDAGSVEVVVPPGESYNVTADSVVGSESVDVVSDPSSPRSITASTQAGSVTVRYSGE